MCGEVMPEARIHRFRLFSKASQFFGLRDQSPLTEPLFVMIDLDFIQLQLNGGNVFTQLQLRWAELWI